MDTIQETFGIFPKRAILNINLECQNCAGHGFDIDPNTLETINCDECDGSGFYFQQSIQLGDK